MNNTDSISNRKQDHLDINLNRAVGSGLTTGLEDYHFTHQALPETNLSKIDLQMELFGKTLSAPLLISSMTGGSQEAQTINHRLAEAAQEMNIPMGVGSQRAALEDKGWEASFQVRELAPDILLFANLGAVQLNYGMGVDDCRRAVEMIEADGLILHLNPLQEAVQPEGETNFKGLADAIHKICRELEVPVIVKEVGWGISQETAHLLRNAGVSAVDVAGAGGTSWSEVEMHRAEDPSQKRIASQFIAWGIPTAESILMVESAAPDLLIFASGGLRNGVDIAKCVALGAALGGMASPFLKAAAESTRSTVEMIRTVQQEIRITMFAAGARDISELSRMTLSKD
jgi:isopentenyl-diphosphate delta-isomerase